MIVWEGARREVAGREDHHCLPLRANIPAMLDDLLVWLNGFHVNHSLLSANTDMALGPCVTSLLFHCVFGNERHWCGSSRSWRPCYSEHSCSLALTITGGHNLTVCTAEFRYSRHFVLGSHGVV